MLLTFRRLTALRTLAGGLLLGAVVADLPALAFSSTAAFLLLHWASSWRSQRSRVSAEEYRFSSVLSTVVVLCSFGVLLVRQSIPVVMAAVFVAASLIMLMFRFRLAAERHDRRFTPMRTNWTLTASMLFLSCYYVEDQGLVLLSAFFLSYLLLAVSVFIRKVGLLQERNSRRGAVRRRG